MVLMLIARAKKALQKMIENRMVRIREKDKPKKALKVAMSREHNPFETGEISRPLELQHG